MISQEVQSVLDKAEKNNNLVTSVGLGMEALGKQVADLQEQIKNMPVGNVLSDEDKAALAETASDLDMSIATLQKTIPANTPAVAPVPTPPLPETETSPEEPPAPAPPPEPTAEEIAKQEEDSAAAAVAKPLAGTGG